MTRYYGAYSCASLEDAACRMFEPELLEPSVCGDVLLGKRGEPDWWITDGFDGGWVVRHPDGRRELWPEGEVFDPYDKRRLAVLAATGRPSDRQADAERAQGALDAIE